MGMPLYYPMGEGPAPAFIYGPAAAIVRLPAALAGSPTASILIADILNVSLFYAPAIAFVVALRGRRLMQAIERIQKNLPAHMEYLIYPPVPESQAMRRMLPQYSEPCALPGLPGWQAYTKPRQQQEFE